MNPTKLLLVIGTLLLINTVHGQENHKQKFKKLEWLIGKWTRTNSKPGNSGYETWAKVSDLKFTGKGVTLKGKETLFVEDMEFISKSKDIFLVVRVTHEKDPVYFKLTELSNDSFTCENPEHDFPKKITYNRTGNKVKAVISGDGKSMDYDFVRSDK